MSIVYQTATSINGYGKEDGKEMDEGRVPGAGTGDDGMDAAYLLNRFEVVRALEGMSTYSHPPSS